LRLTVLPADGSGVVRIDTGAPTSTTDAKGNVWTADIGIEGGGDPIPGDYPHWNKTNPAADLAYESLQKGDDPGYTMIVPNGVYKIHLMFGMPDAGDCTVCTSWLNIGAWNQYDFSPYSLESQGQSQSSSFDWGASSNYMFQTPVDAYIPATVTNNILQVYVRSVFSDLPPYNMPLDSATHTFLNGLEIMPNGAQAPSWSIDTGGQITIAPGQTLRPFSLVASGGAPNDPQWSIISGPAGASLNGSSLSLGAGVNSPGSTILVQASDGTYSATASITEVAPASTHTSSSAAYNGTDTTTQGQWSGMYGADGFIIANDITQLPAYASMLVETTPTYTWAQPTTDPRALQVSRGAQSLIASAYAGNSFTFPVNLSDGKVHRLALYLLDFDCASRTESISILDAGSKAVLDTESFSSLDQGLYASWNVTGQVLVQVTETGNSHAVVSGVFFDTPAPISPIVPAPDTWNQMTIGSLPANVLASEPASVTSFQLEPSDYQIGGENPDSLSMLAQHISPSASPSNIVVEAKISVPAGASHATKGLIVLRKNSSPTAAFVGFGIDQSGQINFQWRACAGCGVNGYTLPYGQEPVWVRVTKTGNNFEAFFSPDGVNWLYGGLVGADFWGDYYVGLESLSDTLTAPPVSFDNVSVLP
jgi:hypothetical protein